MNNKPQFIYIVPIGEVDAQYLTSIAESIEENFGLPVKITSKQGLPAHALDAVRAQYNSNLILQTLLDSAPPDALKVLGVTTVDLFNPIFAFVFGEAQFKGKGAVISSYRLHGNRQSDALVGCPPLLSRLEKEAIHELGHTFGLKHCTDPDCVMQYSVGLECADRKFSYFCATCRELMLWHLGTDLFLRV
jgi:archaemetzincin